MSGNDEDFWENDVMTEEEAEAIANGQAYVEEVEEGEDPADFMEVYEDEYEDMDDEALEEKAEEVLDDALVRLEQGRLYKMLMTHIKDGMLADVDCEDRSIKNVEREMTAFIVSRIEVLLGIRKRKVKVRQVRPMLKSDPEFTAGEQQVLKKLVGNAVAKSGIKPMGSPAEAPKLKSRTAPKKVARKKKAAPLPPAPKGRVKKRTKKTAPKKPLTKSPYEMNADELMERNKQINSGKKNQVVDPSNPPLPPLDGNQMESHYQQQQVMDGGANQTVNTILNIMKNSK